MEKTSLSSELWEKEYQIIETYYAMLIAKKGKEAVKKSIEHLLYSPIANEESRWLQRIKLINSLQDIQSKIQAEEEEYQTRARVL